MFMDDRSGRSDGEGSWRVEGFCRSHPDVAEIQTALELAAADQLAQPRRTPRRAHRLGLRAFMQRAEIRPRLLPIAIGALKQMRDGVNAN